MNDIASNTTHSNACNVAPDESGETISRWLEPKKSSNTHVGNGCHVAPDCQCLEQCSIIHCAESCFKLDGHAGKHLCALHRIVFEGPLGDSGQE